MRLVFDLFKLRIGLVIALTALTGVAVAPGPAPSATRVFLLFAAVLLASAAAGAFNQYWEVDLDERMHRTRMRPFVTGRLLRHAGWPWLLAAMTVAAAAIAWAATNGLAALFTVAGAFVYGVVYTIWLKRRTGWNIVVGGAAGSFAVLAGSAAVSPELSVPSLLLAAVLFLWTPPHFWSLAIAFADDYRRAGVPMLPVVRGDAFAAGMILGHAIALVALSLWLGLLAPGWATLACASAGGLLFVVEAVRLRRAPARRQAMRCFFASLIQLSLLMAGVALDAAVRAAAV